MLVYKSNFEVSSDDNTIATVSNKIIVNKLQAHGQRRINGGVVHYIRGEGHDG